VRAAVGVLVQADDQSAVAHRRGVLRHPQAGLRAQFSQKAGGVAEQLKGVDSQLIENVFGGAGAPLGPGRRVPRPG